MFSMFSAMSYSMNTSCGCFSNPMNPRAELLFVKIGPLCDSKGRSYLSSYTFDVELLSDSMWLTFRFGLNGKVGVF
jgi:hypothetical protein